MSINKVMISGNLTRDAELRTTSAGTSVLTVGVAVNERRRNQQTGDWDEYTNFINCTMFGRRAEAIAQYLTRGTKVAIEGRLHYSQWQDRTTGQNRSKIEVIIDEIEFMSPRNSGGYQQGGYDNGGYGNNGGGYGNGGGYNNGGYNGGGGDSYANNNGGYANDNAPQRSAADIPEAAPTPAAYNDEDIPF